jgi:hypothetical protein
MNNVYRQVRCFAFVNSAHSWRAVKKAHFRREECALTGPRATRLTSR